jgi:protein-S-isoprenylcysteine O-methyltransferase Ste14
MDPKGIERLIRHVPDFNSPLGRLKVGLYALAWFALVTAYFLLTDRIPTWSIDSQIIIFALGYLLLSFFFSRKQAYKEKYGDLAYRQAIAHYGIPGFMTVMAAAAHTAYMNGPHVPVGWWTTVFVALGWLMILVGAGLWARAALAFGLDNAFMLYVYFPEEGRLVDSAIYGVIRHPIYAGALRVIIGLALLNGNANALAFIPFILLGMFAWLRLVEEKELIERFGVSYADHRKRVPAFWPRPRDLGKFFRFIATGK